MFAKGRPAVSGRECRLCGASLALRGVLTACKRKICSYSWGGASLALRGVLTACKRKIGSYSWGALCRRLLEGAYLKVMVGVHVAQSICTSAFVQARLKMPLLGAVS